MTTEDRRGRRWGVYSHYTTLQTVPSDDDRGKVTYRLGGDTPADHYVVRDMFGDDKRSYEFKTSAEAEAHAAELNRYDLHGPLDPDPTFTARRKRLLTIHGQFAWRGAPVPFSRPQRYVARVSYEDCSDVSDYFTHHDTFEEAKDEYRAYYVWDLDTGQKWNVEAVNVATEVSEDE